MNTITPEIIYNVIQDYTIDLEKYFSKQYILELIKITNLLRPVVRYQKQQNHNKSLYGDRYFFSGYLHGLKCEEKETIKIKYDLFGRPYKTKDIKVIKLYPAVYYEIDNHKLQYKLIQTVIKSQFKNIDKQFYIDMFAYDGKINNYNIYLRTYIDQNKHSSIDIPIKYLLTQNIEEIQKIKPEFYKNWANMDERIIKNTFNDFITYLEGVN